MSEQYLERRHHCTEHDAMFKAIVKMETKLEEMHGLLSRVVVIEERGLSMLERLSNHNEAIKEFESRIFNLEKEIAIHERLSNRKFMWLTIAATVFSGIAALVPH